MGGGRGVSDFFFNMNPNLNNKTKINFAGGEGLVGVGWGARVIFFLQ